MLNQARPLYHSAAFPEVQHSLILEVPDLDIEVAQNPLPQPVRQYYLWVVNEVVRAEKWMLN